MKVEIIKESKSITEDTIKYNGDSEECTFCGNECSVDKAEDTGTSLIFTCSNCGNKFEISKTVDIEKEFSNLAHIAFKDYLYRPIRSEQNFDDAVRMALTHEKYFSDRLSSLDRQQVVSKVSEIVKQLEYDRLSKLRNKPSSIVRNESKSIKEELYKDVSGVMGEPNETYTEDDLRGYWESAQDDPSIADYKGDFSAWLKDTLSQMEEVEELDESTTVEEATMPNDGSYSLFFGHWREGNGKSFRSEKDLIEFLDTNYVERGTKVTYSQDFTDKFKSYFQHPEVESRDFFKRGYDLIVDSKEDLTENISETPIEDIDAFIAETKDRFPGSEAFYDGDTNTIVITLDDVKKEDLNESLTESSDSDIIGKIVSDYELALDLLNKEGFVIGSTSSIRKPQEGGLGVYVVGPARIDEDSGVCKVRVNSWFSIGSVNKDDIRSHITSVRLDQLSSYLGGSGKVFTNKDKFLEEVRKHYGDRYNYYMTALGSTLDRFISEYPTEEDYIEFYVEKFDKIFSQGAN